MMMLVDPIMMMVTVIMTTMIMMVFEAINKIMMVIMIVMIAYLDVDLSISVPPTSPSPFAVIKALVQEYDK